MESKVLEKTRCGQADKLSVDMCKSGKRKEMKAILLVIVILMAMTTTMHSLPASANALAQQPLIRFIRTDQVTPDDEFLTGSFARFNYVPATDRFVVTFGTKASTEPNTSLGAGYAYKEYNLEMQETGDSGLLEWYVNASEAGD